MLHLPTQPPEPLRGCDPGSFAEYTVKVRLKQIGERNLQENKYAPSMQAAIISLLDSLPEGYIYPLQDPLAPDSMDWERWIKPYTEKTWLEVPWFFAETYFYRRLLAASGFYNQGAGQGYDPYSYQKEQGLTQHITLVRGLCREMEALLTQKDGLEHQEVRDELAKLLSQALWGNQADLSMWSAGDVERLVKNRIEVGNQDRNLVINSTEAVIDYICRNAPLRLDIVLDNCGIELLSDLFLAQFFLENNLAAEVILHAKSHPTFVSDAMSKDVSLTLEYLHASEFPELHRAGKNLSNWIHSKKLRVECDYFWTSPLAFWDASDGLLMKLAGSGMLISKGDANYRRFLGDRHWAYDLPAKEALGYIPCPFLALRVCKSEVIVGLSPGNAGELDAKDPQWMFDGHWGMIQYVPNPI